MILTNTSALQSQIVHNRSRERINTAFQRISSGKRITSSSTDAGSLSQSKSLHSEKLVAQSYKINLQNTRSFLHAQQEGILKVAKIYDRIEELSLRSMDPTASDADREIIIRNSKPNF